MNFSTQQELVEELMTEGLLSSAELLLSFMQPPPEISLEHTLWKADCLFQQDEYSRAAFYYSKVEESARTPDKKSPYVLKQLAWCHKKLRQPEKIIYYLKKLTPQERDAHTELLLARSLEEIGKKVEALAAYKSVLIKNPLAFQVMVKLVQMGEQPQVILSLCEKTCPQLFSPSSRSAFPWLEPLLEGHRALKKQLFQSASGTFGKLAASYPSSLHALEYEARSDVFADNLNKARACFEKVLQKDPSYVSSIDTYASVLKKLNSVKSLNQVANKLMEVAPDRPETWSAVSLVHNVRHPKQMKTTFAFVDKSLRLDPLYWFGYVQKGWFYLRQGVNESAVECFMKALQIDSNVFSYTGLVKTKITMDRLKQATYLANECYKVFPESPIALALLGDCFARVPENNKEWKEKALNAFRMALKYDVHSIDAIVGITEILVDKKEHGEAIKILEGELESGRHRELIHTRLAEVYHLDNAHANALEHYNAALSVNPNFEAAKEGLAFLTKELFGDQSKGDEDEDDEDDYDDPDGDLYSVGASGSDLEGDDDDDDDDGFDPDSYY